MSDEVKILNDLFQMFREEGYRIVKDSQDVTKTALPLVAGFTIGAFMRHSNQDKEQPKPKRRTSKKASDAS